MKRLIKLIDDVVEHRYPIEDTDLYSPIEYNGNIIFENKRKYKDQFVKRLNYFPDDFNEESVLDVGTNTGFILLQLKKQHNAGHCVGVELNPWLTRVAEELVSLNDLKDIEFYPLNFMTDAIPNNTVFDNTLLLSMGSPSENIYNFGYDRCLDKIKTITRKHIYVEPTNYEHTLAPNLIRFYDEYFKTWGTPECLGTTDYQDRVLYRIKI